MTDPPRRPWRELRRPLAELGLALLLALFAAGAAVRHVHVLQQHRMIRQQELAGALQAYRDQRRDYDLARDFAAPFAALMAKPVADGDRSLRRLDALRRTARQLLLPGMSYRLAPTPEAPTPVDGLVRVTRLTLELQLRHEYELPKFLHTLQRQGDERFEVLGCQLRRNGRDLHFQANVANFSAACELAWLTLQRSTEEP